MHTHTLQSWRPPLLVSNMVQAVHWDSPSCGSSSESAAQWVSTQHMHTYTHSHTHSHTHTAPRCGGQSLLHVPLQHHLKVRRSSQLGVDGNNLSAVISKCCLSARCILRASPCLLISFCAAGIHHLWEGKLFLGVYGTRECTTEII